MSLYFAVCGIYIRQLRVTLRLSTKQLLPELHYFSVLSDVLFAFYHLLLLNTEYCIFRFLYSPHPCPSPEMGGERLAEAKLYNPNGYYILNHHVYNGIYPHLLNGKEQELFNPTYPLSFSVAPCVPARWRNRRARCRRRYTWRGNGSWGNSARCLPAHPRARRRNRSVPFR